MQGAQDIGRLMLTWRQQHRSATPLLTKHPSLGTELPAPYGEGPRKKLITYITQLANRGERAFSHAVERH